MSTFLGLIEEMPGISVDRFDGENLTSSVYFLSHCHCDHMSGLSDVFFQHLRENEKSLYCSPITRLLLESKFKFENLCVKEMETNVPSHVEYKTRNGCTIDITVTLIPAGHCPGSVMFLFERKNVSILYTGDFRINPKDYCKLKALHHVKNSKLLPRTFTKIYLDTTFLSKDFPCFPTRQESLRRICEVAKKWLDESPRNVVILECSATYGSEFLFVELSKIFSTKIHVKSHVYESYRRISQLSGYVTNESQSTRIHACKRKISSSGLHCRGDINEEDILTVIPSAMKWRKKDTGIIGEWDKIKERTYNVCYSTHSSFDELRAFVQYFKASEICPCVIKTESEDEVHRLLEGTKEPSNREMKNPETYKLRFPKRKKSENVPYKSKYFSSDEDS